jgi:cysteine desulfurase
VHGASNLLSRLGFHETRLAVSPDGFVDPLGVESLPKTCTLVSLMLANNETGVLQPVAEVASRAHARGMRLHCDAVQAAGKVAIDLAALGVDYLVISAHKLCGPKGTGALVLASDAPFEPLFRGSPHELGRRGGTENVAGIVGFGVAAELAARELDEERQRLRVLRERFERALHEAVADVVIHGALAPRLPNTVNASFPGARSDDLLMALDARGIAVSAGAACSSGAVEPSPVLTAMGVSRELAVCSLRFSMGRTTVESEVDEVARAVGECVPAVRSFGEKMR